MNEQIISELPSRQNIEFTKTYDQTALDPELEEIVRTGIVSPEGKYKICRSPRSQRTRNLHLVTNGGDSTWQEIVISGFGFGFGIKQEVGDDIIWSYTAPDKAISLKQYCEDHHETPQSSPTYNEQTDRVLVESTDPIGGYSQKSIDDKIVATENIRRVLSQPENSDLAQQVKVPEIIARFKNKGKNGTTYGFIYRRTYVMTCDEVHTSGFTNRDPDFVSDFYTREYQVLRQLHDLGIAHCQLHPTNKGLSLEPGLPIYIGDWEEYLNLNKFDNTRRFNFTKTSIRTDAEASINAFDFSARQIVMSKILKDVIVEDLREFSNAVSLKQNTSDYLTLVKSIINGYIGKKRNHAERVLADFIEIVAPEIAALEKTKGVAVDPLINIIASRISANLVSIYHPREGMKFD